MKAEVTQGVLESSLFFCYFGIFLLGLSSVTSKLLDPDNFSKVLSNLNIEALGVEDLQAELDQLQFTELEIDGRSIISKLTTDMEDKFKEGFEVIEELKATVEASYARPQAEKSPIECCKVQEYTSQNLKFDSRYGRIVDFSQMCAKISGNASSNPRHLDGKALNEMRKIAANHTFIKRQYFGSAHGVLTTFPAFQNAGNCSSYDPRLTPFYVETAVPESKDVVLVIDTSGSMEMGVRMATAKEAAKTVLDTMNPRDRIGLVAFSNKPSTPGANSKNGTKCFDKMLAEATPMNLQFLKSYVQQLLPGGLTHYRPAFSRAFDLMSASNVESSAPRLKLIIFLTDGEPDDNKTAIMQLIKERNVELGNRVVILTYGMQVDVQLLRDIANQDGSSYGVSKSPDITPGKFTSVMNIKYLRGAMATYYDMLLRNTSGDQPIISTPYMDSFSLGLITSITLPCYSGQQFIGVAGTDISMEDLLSNITYLRKSQASYAFMVDSSGRAMMHPLLPSPSDPSHKPIFLDIRALEPDPGFVVVYDSIKLGGSGQTTFVSKQFLPRGGKATEGLTLKETNTTYYWMPVGGTNFTVGLVIPEGDKQKKMAAQSILEGSKFLYHRLDLVKPTQPCVHFSRYAANGTTVVKFGPAAFIDPYTYFDLDETKSRINSFVAYMTSSQAPNPGFKEGIRDSVIATEKIEDIWFRKRTNFTQYMVRRFIATVDGVLRMTPGISLAKSYEPRQRPWYRSALSNAGLVALSTPYVDAFGAGVVITAAHTVYRGESHHQHSSNDDVIGVMGADFPLSYFEKLLTGTYPKCKETTYSCFIIDGAGFLIMHDDFLVPNITAETLEYIHITKKEKDIAEDLLKKGYMVKKECRNFEEIKKESFYEIRLPSYGVDTLNIGELCKKYQLSSLAGSNAFLGIIWRENNCSSKSCHCSRDLQCSSVSGQGCLCPCSVNLYFRYCESKYLVSNLSICPVSATAHLSDDVVDPSTEGLGKCFDPQCGKRPDSESCKGVVGCYWCVRDRNDAPLFNQYCADINKCYGGKEGTRVPGASVVSTNKPRHMVDTGTAEFSVVAIVGIVFGCVLVMVVLFCVIYWKCWRGRMTRQQTTKRPSVTNTSVVYLSQSCPPLHSPKTGVPTSAATFGSSNHAMENPAYYKEKTPDTDV